MDGVISDTQKFHTQIESAILADYGINIAPEEITYRYAGFKDISMFKKEFEKHNKKADLSKILKRKWERMFEMSKNNIASIEGVIDFVNDMYKNNYQLAIASSSPHNFIELVLTELNIINNFKARISGEDVTHGKPDPDIFLLAAERLGVLPSECVVIEDAVNGIVAANSAGMKSMAITTNRGREELKNADKVIDSFHELSSDIIQSL
jgi:HAD superfamily hydrolase (TIGR01509 family)